MHALPPPGPDHCYYFAYNEHMNVHLLEADVGPVQWVDNAVLDGYYFTFGTRHKGEVRANVVKSRDGSYVEGVVYKLTKTQRTLLDMSMGAPDVYHRFLDVVYSVDSGESMGGVNFYVCENNNHFTSKPPNLWYILSLIRGAQESNLDDCSKSLINYLIVQDKVKTKKAKRDGKSVYR